MSKGKIYSVESFLETVLPEVITNKQTFRSVFSTYNSIHDYDDGLVAGLPKDLIIRVASGGSMPSMDMFMMLSAAMVSGDPEFRREVSRTYVGEAENLVDFNKKRLSRIQQKNAPNMFVVYGGLRGFQTTINLITDLKKKFPKCFVVMLACDCDQATKTYEFERQIEKKVIDAAIFNYACGGREPMKDLLEGLVSSWKDRKVFKKKKMN